MNHVKWWLITRRSRPPSRKTPQMSPTAQPRASGRPMFMPSASGRYQRCWNITIGSRSRSLRVGEVVPAARIVAQDPAHVREPEAPLRAVGVLVHVVHEPVVGPVLRPPDQDRVLQRHRAEEHEEQSRGPVRLVGAVRPEPVVARGDRDAARPEEEDHACPRPQAVAVREPVPRHQRQRRERCRREHGGREPVDRRVFIARHGFVLHQ